MGEGGEGRAKAERGENEGSEGRTRGGEEKGRKNERRAKLTKWGGYVLYI